ncbi:MAG: hypothetical protein QNJ14_02360 [Woeseiaceae bacterium]|nr:hypothetical protein [Woeseiaceae bacterium]
MGQNRLSGWGVLAFAVVVTALSAYWLLDNGNESRAPADVNGGESAESDYASPPPDGRNASTEIDQDGLESAMSSLEPARTAVEKSRTGTPSGPLAETLAEIKNSAQAGDADLAYSLHLALSACAGVPRSESDYQATLSEMTIKSENLQGKYVNDVSPEIDRLNSAYNYCSGVKDEELENAAYWLWYAAENGSVEAKTFFLSSAVPFADSEAAKEIWGDDAGQAQLGIQYLKEAADAGSVNAMASYAYYSSTGTLVEQSDFESAVYQVAAASIHAATDEADSSRQKAARNALAKLSYREYELVLSRAKEIVDSADCCVEFR